MTSVARSLCAAALGLLIALPSVNALADERPGTWTLSDSRVIFRTSQNNATLHFKNNAVHPWLVQATVYNAGGNGSPTEKTEDFLISPPLKTVSSREDLPLKIVKVKDPVKAETEKLYWLKLTAIPAKEKTDKPDPSELKLATTAWIKLLLRPEGFSKKDSSEVLKITQKCTDKGLELKNDSGYWVTVRNVLSGDKNLIDPKHSAPLISPNGSLILPITDCKPDAKVQIIDDFGFLTTPGEHK